MKKILVAILSISLVSCVFVSRRVDIEPVSTRSPVTVRTAVKAHLKDGAMVEYPSGVTVTADSLTGEGTKYDLTRTTSARVETIPLSEVIGMETYRTAVNTGESILVSTLASAGGFALGVVLAVAIFGSCPTVYSDDGAVEEAELFSSSIAPLFEGRDIDRLQAQADAHGHVTLDIRNEAMETHYLNHLQVLEVAHAENERVIPDAHGAPIVVGDLRRVATATNRDGRDLRPVLASRDGRFSLTERRTLDRATASDMDDWIDFTIPVETGSASAALVFRMRNSLLNTILLYDVMLGPSGASALDWLGYGLGKISTAVELGRWHQRRAGLHISVWQDGAYKEVARVPDSGPISWHDVAAVVPVPPGEKTLRVRLSYLADHWRIDELAVSFAARTPESRTIPLAGVTASGGAADVRALANMAAPDEKYLQTNPGDRFTARFDAGPSAARTSRTFLLSSQGYYTEWIRGSWIQTATVTEPFMPSDGAVLTAMRKWGATRDSFEQRFLQARVPVR